MGLFSKFPIDRETLRKKWYLYILLAVSLALLIRELSKLSSHAS